MPTVAVKKDSLVKAIGKEMNTNELESIVFDFGVELDEIYEEDGCEMLKFDIPANRYDLLCVEGFSQALKCYMGLGTFEDLSIAKDTTARNTTVVHRKKTHEREHIACAVIRGISFDKNKYESFIDYQDKLHLSLGRNRSLIAVGTHDMAKLNGRISYESVELSDVNFMPLGISDIKSGNDRCIGNDINNNTNITNTSNNKINGKDLKEFFAKDKKISKYFDLLSDPHRIVAFKCNGNVMSLPPIINSEDTKISLETKDIFVEVTGSDFNKVNTALKYILYNFRGVSVERVIIESEYSDNTTNTNITNNNDITNINTKDNCNITTPVFNNFTFEMNLKMINKKLHLQLTAEEAKTLLERMLYTVTIKRCDLNSPTLHVHIPDVRSDVLHQCDVIEDIAISYGFNNFKFCCPPIYTVGFENPLNKFSDKIRQEMAIFGFVEALTLTLLSRDENIVDSHLAVVLDNPKSKEYEVVRTSLLPGLLKSISSNLHGKIPIKMFEVADVVVLSEDDEGARNVRRLCCVVASNRSLLEDVQGPLSMLFEKCGIVEFEYSSVDTCISDNTNNNTGNSTNNNTSNNTHSTHVYLENQNANVCINGLTIGTLGVLHPHVCQKFGIPYAASAFEIDVQVLFERFLSK